ncbi:hypothetical protein BST30_04060 [Mycobacterium mantenii]|uniref:Uncharacterized protein n=1 Tax=Mycobacterium mantenii TaxID=560555 RepID=A0A1X0G359_MYCNT|nr:hypothetical protein BST30_04060 [Mycobacterium mantenii]
MARAAATIVAVTPTLDARSQVSPSYLVEVMCVPLSEVANLIFSRYNKLPPLYASRDSRQPVLMAYAAAGQRVLIAGAWSGRGAAR